MAREAPPSEAARAPKAMRLNIRCVLAVREHTNPAAIPATVKGFGSRTAMINRATAGNVVMPVTSDRRFCTFGDMISPS